MILIAHRGNIRGQNKELENNPDYILNSIKEGYNVEVDVRYINDQWYLGHDEPQYKIDLNFLKNKNLWCHAKNLEGFLNLLDNKIRCFWHQNDNFTLTSDGYIWTYPGFDLTKKSICVMPEWSKKEISLECAGICSDFIEKYR